MSRLRAALFDAAGTLLVASEPVGETYARIIAEHGAEISAWRLGDAFTRIHAAAPPMAFPSAPVDAIAVLERDWWRSRVRETLRAADSTVQLADFDACFDALFAHYSRPEAWTLRDGAIACLGALRERGLATGIVSNFDGRLPGILEALGLLALLDIVVLPGAAGAAKPDPLPFRMALDAVGCTASEAVYIGDDPTRDGDGAREVGLTAIDVAELATLADLPARLDAFPE